MWKLTILLALAVLGCAQEDSETPQNKEDENVTTLNLSNQDITSLGEYDFSKYPNLEELDLSNNNIQHIKQDVFNKNKRLKKLNLSGNKNLTLPGFSTLLDATIEELDLSNCNIEEFPPNIFDGLLDLKVLNLSGNPLREHAIQPFTINNLNDPKEIILPHIDEAMIREICKEPRDITIGIKSEGYSDSIPCADVREGTWQNIAKEIPDHEASNTDEENHPAEDHPNETDVINAEALTHGTNEEIEQANPADANGDQTAAETSNTGVSVAPEETNHDETTEPEAPLLGNEDNAKPEGSESDNQAESEPSPGEHQDNAEPEPSPPEVKASDTETNTEPTDETKPEYMESLPDAPDTILDEHPDTEAPGAAETSKTDEASSAEGRAVVPDQTGSSLPPPDDSVPDAVDGKTAPDAVDGRNAPVNESQQVPQNVSNDNKQGQPPFPRQRAINVPLPPDAQNTETRAALPGQKSEKMQENKADTSEAKVDAATGSSTGTNVLIFLVVAVIVAGIGAFGYKFYKSRKYQAANTTEPVERELKEIVVDRRSNGPGGPKDVIEEEPLMEDRKHSVEIKEIEETTEKPNEVLKNDVPKKAANETTASSSNNRSPYVPTTTPIKPPHVNKDNKTQI